MTPFAGSLEVVGEGVVQIITHADDTFSHALDFTFPTIHRYKACVQQLAIAISSQLGLLALPLLVQSSIAEDSAGNTSAVERRVRVQWTDDDLDLAVYTSFLFGARSGEREETNTFAVKTHILLVSCQILDHLG